MFIPADLKVLCLFFFTKPVMPYIISVMNSTSCVDFGSMYD